MKVAIIHYWLVQMRGGEHVLEELCAMFPQADIFTHVYNPSKISKNITKHRVITTFISGLPYSKRYYKFYLPFMYFALEQIDLSGYDLVISCESGPAKGVIPPPNSYHVCYCHTPMRYLWDKYHLYLRFNGFITRFVMRPVFHFLRIQDSLSANRVDCFIANSSYVAARIKRFYRRDSQVIFPPIDTEKFNASQPSEAGDFYLYAGELVSYKRPDLVVEAFNRSGKKLVIVGDGPLKKSLQSRAGTNIQFLGYVGVDRLKELFRTCKALVFPGEEDFGLVPLEVMQSGRPVIALGKGGALDTLIDGQTGVLYQEESSEALQQAVERFESMGDVNWWKQCREQASKFSQAKFRHAIKKLIKERVVS